MDAHKRQQPENGIGLYINIEKNSMGECQKPLSYLKGLKKIKI
jgi:hypothetical protein